MAFGRACGSEAQQRHLVVQQINKKQSEHFKLQDHLRQQGDRRQEVGCSRRQRSNPRSSWL